MHTGQHHVGGRGGNVGRTGMAVGRGAVGFMAGIVVGFVIGANLEPNREAPQPLELKTNSILGQVNQTSNGTSHANAGQKMNTSTSCVPVAWDNMGWKFNQTMENRGFHLDKNGMAALLGNCSKAPTLNSHLSSLVETGDVRQCISSVTKGYWIADVFVSQSPFKCNFRMFDWRQAGEVMQGKHLSLNGDSLTRRLTNTFDVLLKSQNGFRTIPNSKLSTGWHDQLHLEYRKNERSSSLHYFWNEGVYVHGPGKCRVVRRSQDQYTHVMLGYGLHHVIDHGSRCVGECPERFVLCIQTAMCDLCDMEKTPYGIWRTAPYSSGKSIVPGIQTVNAIARSLLFLNGSVWESERLGHWTVPSSLTSLGVSRQVAERAIRAMQVCCAQRGKSKRKLRVYLLDHEQLLLDRSQGSNRISGDTENHFGDAARVAEVESLLNLMYLIDLDRF
eukprot:764160-Hanusia_phi.AAC.1